MAHKSRRDKSIVYFHNRKLYGCCNCETSNSNIEKRKSPGLTVVDGHLTTPQRLTPEL